MYAHLVVSWTATTTQYYLNGSPIGSPSQGPGPTDERFRLGHKMWGSIDETRLFDMAMNATDIAAIP